MVALNDEMTVTIAAVRPWGFTVHLPDGTEGLIDKVQTPAWAAREPLPVVGDSMLVAVVDDTRSPIRLSALPQDIEIARSFRSRRGS